MKKISLLVALSFLVLTSYAQVKDTVYLDEDFKKISLNEFKKKLKSNLFVVTSGNSDSIFYKKLRFIEYFGKLDYNKKHQLNRLFHQRFKIDTSKIWLIRYRDSLPNVNLMHSKSGVIILDSLGNAISEIMSYNKFQKIAYGNAFELFSRRELKKEYKYYKYVTSYKDYYESASKRIKRFRRNKNLLVLDFFEKNNGFPLDEHKELFYEDYNLILKRIFTDGLFMYKTIVIYPDGNFYAISYQDSLDKQKEMVKYKSYIKNKKIWLTKHKLIH